VNLFQVNPFVSSANLLTNLGGSTYNAGYGGRPPPSLERPAIRYELHFFERDDQYLRKPACPFDQSAEPAEHHPRFSRPTGFTSFPVGHGQMLLGSAHGVLDRVVSGWSIDGTGARAERKPIHHG